MYQDILLPLTRTSGRQAALAPALALVARMQARLTVLVIVDTPLPMATEWGGFPGTLYAELYDDACRDCHALADSLLARLTEAGIDGEVRVVDSPLEAPARSAALHARWADLALLTTATGAHAGGWGRELFVDLLMDSGRPVLLLPADLPASLPPQRAVVAWKNTAEASRAVHDALPLLRGAERVDVLTVSPSDTERASANALVAHLDRHGLPAHAVEAPREGRDVAEVLLGHAGAIGAGLLVAGGYGHSRVREQVLGGVTQHLLQHSTLPVLFAH